MFTELQLDLDNEWPTEVPALAIVEAIPEPEPERVAAPMPEPPITLRRVYEDEEWRELMEVDEW